MKKKTRPNPYPPDPKSAAEVPAYVDACWPLSVWARVCYQTKEEAVRQITELLNREGK